MKNRWLMFALFAAPSALHGLEEKRVADMFRSLSTPADMERQSAILVVAICAGIFVVVGGLLAYSIFRFRRRPGDDLAEPPQVYGSSQIELAWTVIPILIVFVLIGVTARVVAAVEDAAMPANALHVTVIGHQWWWEISYPDYGFTTANEVHVPVSLASDGRPSQLTLESADVIHSFWVPQLAGKTDAIPNRANNMWIDPREPGIYYGNCAAYCGTQHANMLLKVVVQPVEEFNAWVAQQKQGAATDASAAEGRATFESLSCVNCHTVRGTAAKGRFGPDLTHLMSRFTLASGTLSNRPEELRRWIRDPQEVKPGSLMPAMQLSDDELNGVVAYVSTLK
jgi:cytochrome c oxidase subunit II